MTSAVSNKPAQLVAIPGLLQIQADAALAAIGVAEKYRVLALAQADVTSRVAAAGRLDLDHVRAMISHDHGQVRPREKLGQVDDAVAFELHATAAACSSLNSCSVRPASRRSSSVSAPNAEQTLDGSRLAVELDGVGQRSKIAACGMRRVANHSRALQEWIVQRAGHVVNRSRRQPCLPAF